MRTGRGLGAPIVGAARNPASPGGNWPGVDPPLGPEVATIPSVEPNLELIASFRPDLILATTWQPAYGAAYDQLSQIAPVVSYRTALLQDSGPELVELIGAALGEPAKAADLTERSDRAVADFAARHPGLTGATFAFGQHVGGVSYIVVAPNAPSTVFFRGLGMRLPDRLAALPVQQAPGVTKLGGENAGLLDSADVVLLGVPTEADRMRFSAQPVVAALPLAADGRLKFLTLEQTNLLLAPNPAVTPAILQIIEPLLSEVTPRG